MLPTVSDVYCWCEHSTFHWLTPPSGFFLRCSWRSIKYFSKFLEHSWSFSTKFVTSHSVSTYVIQIVSTYVNHCYFYRILYIFIILDMFKILSEYWNRANTVVKMLYLHFYVVAKITFFTLMDSSQNHFWNVYPQLVLLYLHHEREPTSLVILNKTENIMFH